MELYDHESESEDLIDVSAECERKFAAAKSVERISRKPSPAGSGCAKINSVIKIIHINEPELNGEAEWISATVLRNYHSANGKFARLHI